MHAFVSRRYIELLSLLETQGLGSLQRLPQPSANDPLEEPFRPFVRNLPLDERREIGGYALILRVSASTNLLRKLLGKI